MTILEQYNDTQHRQEAVFLYEEEAFSSNVRTAIIQSSLSYFEEHKIQLTDEPLVIAQCQYIDGALISAQNKVPYAGPTVSVAYTGGKKLHNSTAPWRIVISQPAGRETREIKATEPLSREVLEVVVNGAVYVLSKRYDQQGRLRSQSVSTEVMPVWSLVVSCMQTEDATKRALGIVARQHHTSEAVNVNRARMSLEDGSEPSKLELPQNQLKAQTKRQYTEDLLKTFSEKVSESHKAKQEYEAFIKQYPDYEVVFRETLDDHRRGKRMSPEVLKLFGHIESLKERAGVEADLSTIVERLGRSAVRELVDHLNNRGEDVVHLGERCYEKSYFPPLNKEYLFTSRGLQRLCFAPVSGRRGDVLAGRDDYRQLLSEVLLADIIPFQ